MDLKLVEAYLLLGSNLGERELILEKAVRQIEDKVGSIFEKSSIYETAPWGNMDQPSFLNMAIGVRTNHQPLELLRILLAIEESLGRVRHEKWGERLIDIDIILYGDEVINAGSDLIIPHPEMHNRKFVLQPLAEIAPDVIHPTLNNSVSKILASLTDPLAVEKK